MSLNFQAILIFLVGVSTWIKVRLVGDLYGSDIMLLLICLQLASPKNTILSRANSRDVRYILIAWLLWLLGLIISDLVRGTESADFIRGWARVLFFGTDFIGIVLLVRWDFRNLKSLLYGWATALLLTGLFPSNEVVANDPWKFAFSTGISLLILILATKDFVRLRWRTVNQIGLLFLASGINLLTGLRSMFAIFFIAAFYSWLKLWLERMPTLRKKLTPIGFVVLSLIGVLVSLEAKNLYVELASSGYLGEDAKDKYLEQSRNDLGLFLAGRSEILISSRAIANSPIIGHGSWARDVTLVSEYIDLLAAAGLPVNEERYYEGTAANEAGLIPTHSYLFGSWVEAGILGAAFWILALFMCVKALYRILKVNFSACCLVIPFLFLAIWDFLFSPFAGDHRFTAAVTIYIILWTLHECAPDGRSAQSIKQASQFDPA